MNAPLASHPANDTVLAAANQELMARAAAALKATEHAGRTRDEYERTVEIAALAVVAELRSVGYAARIKDAGRGWGFARYEIARG